MPPQNWHTNTMHRSSLSCLWLWVYNSFPLICKFPCVCMFLYSDVLCLLFWERLQTSSIAALLDKQTWEIKWKRIDRGQKKKIIKCCACHILHSMCVSIATNWPQLCCSELGTLIEFFYNANNFDITTCHMGSKTHTVQAKSFLQRKVTHVTSVTSHDQATRPKHSRDGLGRVWPV